MFTLIDPLKISEIVTFLTGNRKTWARIPAQSKASFLTQKDFKFFKFSIKFGNVLRLFASVTTNLTHQQSGSMVEYTLVNGFRQHQ